MSESRFLDVRSATAATWLARAAAGLILGALGGCSGEGEWGDVDAELAEDETFGSVEQAITRGELVPGNFTSVVKIEISDEGFCTASKLKGTNKFLTAAHCIDNENPGTIDIILGNNGVSDRRTLTVPNGNVQVHPSFKLRTVGTTFPNQLDVYDVAIITTTTATADITGLSLPSNQTPHAVPSNATGYGFGCDLNPGSTNEGKRQSGFFALRSHPLDLSGTGDELCSGDSGGPLLSSIDASIVGVAEAGPLDGTSYWTRTGNVLGWLANPKPGNDPSLFTTSGDIYFYHNKKAGTPLRPTGRCLVANSNTNPPQGNPGVLVSTCSDPFGKLTGKGSGWTALATTPAGQFTIVNRATGYCLAPGSNLAGSNLQVFPCNGSNAQKWSFVRTTAAGAAFATLRVKNLSSGMCITTEGGSTVADAIAEQGTCVSNNTNDSVQSWVASR